ncbi:MAG: argininosuccinate lyase, partial [Burkholderiales bacterium]|nr:argininosuccinate lyase [Burkholderiales bacterium]
MTDQFAKKSEAWSARFSEPVAELVKRYTASVDFDKRLALHDIEGSLAHADMLLQGGTQRQADQQSIRVGLSHLRGVIESRQLRTSYDLD